MNILYYPSYINILEIKEFSGRTTGYGYMVHDIVSSIARIDIHIDLLTQGNITQGHKYKNINILRRTWWDILSNLTCSNLWIAFKAIVNDRVHLNMIPNYILYYISMGYFEKLLKNNSYDLVHIHGIGPSTLPIISTCKKNKVRYLVTLHGLNSFSKSINVSKKHKQLEKKFLKQAEQENIPVTVISSGIKRKILNYLNISDSKNFIVITNGCDTHRKGTSLKIDIRKQYDISENKSIMLCVGNIYANKNQIQVVRAFNHLPDHIQKELVILFLGKDTTNGEFENAIAKTGNGKNLISCGNIPKNDVAAYYSQADYNIVASISEGFGLSIIEGFTYGLPCLTFADLDAVHDLYHEKTMLLEKERDDKTLADGIFKMHTKKWDKSFIQEYAQNFSLEQMAEKYMFVYKNILNGLNNQQIRT